MDAKLLLVVEISGLVVLLLNLLLQNHLDSLLHAQQQVRKSLVLVLLHHVVLGNVGNRQVPTRGRFFHIFVKFSHSL
jgi:hypothetical protein